MRIKPDTRLFWFLKDDRELDLSDTFDLELYIRQVITYGVAKDIQALFKNIDFMQFKKVFEKLCPFLPFEIRKFWEDAVGNN